MSSILQVGQVLSEERHCRGINNCALSPSHSSPWTTEKSAQDGWAEWSQCTRECGGGYQIKIRSGSTSDRGHSSTVIQRACNTQPCAGQWGCWSNWSNCDPNTNRKHRTRHCKNLSGLISGDRTSPLCTSGTSYEEMSCDGWGVWSSWSQCDLASDTRYRTRACQATDCGERGHDIERQACNGLPQSKANSASSDILAVACLCSFVLGAGVGAAAVLYLWKYRKAGQNGSPHYVSAKSQNLYVSLPMLDLKHKHLSSNQSDCGTLRSTSTLRSKAGSSVYNAGGRSDYETATIKRSHSQSHRNSTLIGGGASALMRADLDSDQLFN